MSVGLLAQMDGSFQSTSTFTGSGSQYSSQISTVGATDVPSSFTTTEGTGTHSGRVIHKIGGMDKDPGKPEPIGEPLAMLLFAAFAAGVIYFKRKKSTTNMKNTSKFLTSDTMSRVSRECRPILGRLSTLLLLLLMGLGFSQQAWAGTNTTVYYAVDATTVGCYTVKYNANKKGDGDAWITGEMTKTSNTINGKIVYKATFTDDYNGLGKLQFQLYDGSTWKSQEQPISGWTSASTYNDKVYTHGVSGWKTPSYDASYTIYFADYYGWGNDHGGVKAYAWNSGCDYNAAWNGKEMTATDKTYNGKTIYSITIDKRYTKVKISAAKKDNYATGDLDCYSNSGKICIYDGSAYKWVTYNYDVTLTFKNGTTTVATKTLLKGGTTTAPADPSKTGYTFGGWWNGSNKFVSGTTTINADITYTAKWTPKTYTLYLANNDGSDDKQTVTVTYNSNEITGTINPLTRTGYNFGGWQTNTTGGSLIINSSGVLQAEKPNWTDASGNWIKDADKQTLYGKWTEKGYPVIVNAGAGGSVASTSVTATYFTPVALPKATPEDGYHFVNWTASSNKVTITNPTSADGATITCTGSGQTVTANFALDATYDLTVVAGDGVSQVTGGKTGQITLPFSSSISATPKTGYSFEKWTKSGEGDVTYTSGSATSANATVSVSGGSVTLTASATPINYTITYNGLEGGTHTNPANYTIETATITLTDASRDNYTFDGWYDAATGGNKVTQIAQGSTGNKTLWARWYETLHSVNIASSTGIESVSPAGETNVGNVTPVQISATVKAGYTWRNWTTDNSSKVTITDANANPTTIKATGNTNVYAHATENMTAVTVSSNNTTWGTVSSASVNVGVSTSRQVTATPKPGYKFVSWTLDGGATSTSTLTNTTITIKGDGSSATGTAVATFAEDLSSNWYLAGTSPMFPNGWNTGETNMMKRAAGHSTENVYYFTIHVDDKDIKGSGQESTYQFKIRHYKENECNDYFGSDRDGNHFWVNQTSTMTLRKNGNDDNLYFIPTIAGDYEFKVDATNGADVKLTVTWPSYNCVYGEFNSWSKDANKLEFNGGDEASTVVNITNISKSYEFLVLVNSNYLTNNASFTTPITRSTAGNIAFATKGSSDGNSKFTPDVAGDYTFTYNKSTNKLTITYPALPTASTSATEKRIFNESELSFIESGDGTEANPYKIYTDEALTINIAALTAQTNLTAKYQFGEDPATTDVLTKTITNPSIDKTSILIKAFYESDGVAGTAWEKTIYYQGIPTPTLHLTTSWDSHNDEAKEGSEVPANVTVYYSTTNYNGPATVTRSKDGATAETFFTVPNGTDQMNQIYNLPDQNVQRQTFVATAMANGRTFTATKAISIYRLVEITITDEHHRMDHYYMWENGTNPLHEETAWPGNTFFSTLGNAHIFYVKYPSYTHFVLNDGKQEGAIQTVNVTVPDQSTCYTIGEKITTEGDDKGKYAVQVASECPNKLYVGDIPVVSAVQGEGVMVSPQVDIDPLLNENDLTISFNYGSTQGITCDQRGRSFMVTATAGTGTYNIHVTYSIPGAESVTKSVTIKVTSAIMIQAKIGKLGWNDSGNHDNVWLHYWMSDGSTGDILMSWKDYVDDKDRYYARIPLGSDGKVNFMIGYPNNGEYWGENWRMSNDVTNVSASGCYTITDGGEGKKRSINREGDNCWTLYYVEIDMNNGTVYRSNTVEDLTKQVSFFAPGSSESQAKSGLVRIICNGSQTAVVDAATFTKSGIYTAKITANGEGLSDVAPYTGDYYIRTDGVDGGWNDYVKDSHKFTYFTPYEGALYDYYWVMNKKVNNQGDKLNIKGCVGNGINDNLANMIEASNYTDGYGDIIPDAGTGVNLRFGYNPETNYFERSILRGSTQGESDFLNLIGANIYNNKSCTQELNEANYSAHADWSKFSDISNWVYEKNVYVKIEGAQQSAQALLKSKAFNGTTIYQLGYTLDNFGRQTGTPAQRDILAAGTTNNTYNIRVIYDFKTNRIVSAWSPIGDVTYNSEININADVLFVRHEGQSVAQVNLSNDAAKVSSLKSAYFVMEIDGSSDKASESMYWFSVPFDCEISSIFGVEGYVTLDDNGSPTAGTWGIQEYDGKTRAEKGWYETQTKTFWRWMRKNETLKKGNGYILVFDRADADSKGLWSSISREEPCEGTDDGCKDGKKTVTTTILRLYFPSSESGWKMTRSGKAEWVDYEDWTCQKKNRKAQDSNWRLLGTDSYSDIQINAETQFKRTEKDSVLDKAPNFVYEFHPERGQYDWYVPVSSLAKPFQSFYCYMVQFSGKINWNQYTQSEPEGSVAARHVVAENELTNAQMTLSLKKGSTTEDNTFIYMDVRATTDFDNQMDLTKITDTRANHIYSVINEVEYAGNTLPVEDQIVPLTVNVNANGAYTFTMPNMTDGLEVYLIDNMANAHIDMAIDSYTVDLNKGKIADRFYLDVRVKERTTPTIIETIGTDGYPTGDRFIKVIQNDQLRIIRNGRIYNASGMELNR